MGVIFIILQKKFQRPFDEIFIKSMQETTKYLCENIQGVVLGYIQSDEISLVLIDYKKLNSQAWFDNRQDKMESVSASMTTMAFNKFFAKNVKDFRYNNGDNFDKSTKEGLEKYNLSQTYLKAIEKGAMFDARVFNIPKEDVTNNIYWRQLDCARNSVQMMGQANFSHKELYEKKCNDIKNMLKEQKGINWDELATYQKVGTCVVKDTNNKWIIDKNIPIFKGEGREYIERTFMIGE